ncbi:ATP-binding protein, partial [Candidatus Woesearchaeota archaeon]|nr:ATP-binding protein [Candidatus Woesearchaeota archaeon]
MLKKSKIKRKSEIDNIVTKITNKIRQNGIMLPKEFDEICKNFTDLQKKTVLKILQKKKYEIVEGMIKFNENVKADERITDNEIFSYLIRPEFVDTQSDYIQIGSQYYKGLVATGFPAQVTANWLGNLTQEKGNMDFSIFIEPSSVRALEEYLNGQLKKVENDLYKYESRGISNPSLENRKKELLEQLNNIISGAYKLYKMKLYLATKSASKDKIETAGTKIMSSLHSEGIEAKYALKYQEQLLKSIIPTSVDYLKGREILVPGPAAAASFPFSSAFYEADEKEGVLLGFNDNGIPLGLSLWKLDKYVGVVLGASGAGKSYATKAFILNDRMVNGTKVFVLDPENEYTDMSKALGDQSQVISLSRKSKNIPNILSLFGGNLTDKLIALPKIFNVLLGGITEVQKPLLEGALIMTYKRKKITEDNSRSWKKRPPTLSDLVKTLKDRKSKIKEHNIRAEYEILISKLERYTKGIFKFMNTKGHGIDVKKDFTVFEFRQMPDEVRPVLMLILLEFIKTKFNQDNNKKMLVLDEAWRLLKTREEADYVEGFARTFRKKHGALLLVTQSVAELKGCEEGKAY